MLRLTILSVLAAWSLLGVIAGGLLMILNALKSVRRHMERIAMGVRAIETETAPLGRRVGALTVRRGPGADALSAIAARVGEIGRDLDAVAPALRPRA
jgi:type II secretory pathway component PulJ